MATRTTFIVQFPEFTNTAAALVQAHLDAASLEIDPDLWLLKADQGQMYLAAHKLALSPYGNNAQMVLSKPADSVHGQTTYGIHYDAMVRQIGAAAGFRVA